MNPNSFETTKYAIRSLVVDLWIISQSVENNQSVVGWSIHANSTVGSWYTTKNIHLDLNGVRVYDIGTGSINLDENTGVASGQITITHNAEDGKKTIPVHLEGGIYSYSVYKTVDGNSELPTIARSSAITATDANIESATSININRASSNFLHTLRYVFGDLSGTIATGVSTSYGWTIPALFYAKIPNVKYGTVTLYCDTYSGSTLIGTTSTTFKATVNEITNAPDVSAIIIDTNSISTALTNNVNNLIKFISNANVTITSAAKNSATISSVKVICADGKYATTANSTLNGVESGVFIVEATDSRGIKGTITYTKSIIDYVKLTINALFYRPSSTTGEVKVTYNGNYYNGSFGSSNNSLSIQYRYKVRGTTTWSDYITLTPTIVNNAYGAVAFSLGTGFTYTEIYDFEVRAVDGAMTINPTIPPVAAGKPIYWWNKLSFAVEGILNIKGKNILDLIYPTGTLYITEVASFNPNTEWIGTWSLDCIGQTIVGVDTAQTEFNTVNKTGGSKYMLQHGHTYSGTVSWVGDHEHGLRGYWTVNTGSSKQVAAFTDTYGGVSGDTPVIEAGAHDHTYSGTTANAGTGNSGNLQPYKTKYMWTRTA